MLRDNRWFSVVNERLNQDFHTSTAFGWGRISTRRSIYRRRVSAAITWRYVLQRERVRESYQAEVTLLFIRRKNSRRNPLLWLRDRGRVLILEVAKLKLEFITWANLLFCLLFNRWIIHLTGTKRAYDWKKILLFWLTCGFNSFEKPVLWLQKCIFDDRQAALFDWHRRLVLKGRITWYSSSFLRHRSHLGSVVHMFGFFLRKSGLNRKRQMSTGETKLGSLLPRLKGEHA